MIEDISIKGTKSCEKWNKSCLNLRFQIYWKSNYHYHVNFIHTVWSLLQRYLRSKLSSLHRNVTDYTVTLSYYQSRHVSLISDNQREPEASWRPVADYREERMESLSENPATSTSSQHTADRSSPEKRDDGEISANSLIECDRYFDLSTVTPVSFGKLIRYKIYIRCSCIQCKKWYGDFSTWKQIEA